MAPEEPATQRFKWPPRRADSSAACNPLAVAPPDSGEPASAPAPRLAAATGEPEPSLIASFERTWLGLATPPLRIRLANWSPDKPSAYCPRCGTSCGPFESTLTGCPTCSERKLPWERLIRLSEHGGTIRDMIHEVKFTRWRRLGDQLGQLLGESINTEITRAGLRASDFTLVPIPSSFLRRIARGIDHAVVIARGVSRSTGIPLAHALTRSHRPSQVSIPASSRAANVAGSIRAKRSARLRTPYLLVLDDVTTTRATLTTGCRALGAAYKVLPARVPRPKFWTAVVAVTPRPNSTQSPRM